MVGICCIRATGQGSGTMYTLMATALARSGSFQRWPKHRLNVKRAWVVKERREAQWCPSSRVHVLDPGLRPCSRGTHRFKGKTKIT